MPQGPASLDEVRDIPAAKIPVRETLKRYEIVPRKRFGQNFLHDAKVCARIVQEVESSRGRPVLEIGPGLGALTRPLLDAGVAVTAVEVDRKLAAFLVETLGGRPGFRLHCTDILDADLDEIAPDARTLVANLPYSITGPVLSLLIARADRFDRCVIMVQREVAARLLAASGTRAVGAPTVLLRLLYRVERRFDVGTGAFIPRPEIVSTVLRLERLPGTDLSPGLRDAVNLAFRHRRKMVRKTLGGVVAPEEAIAAALSGLGYSDRARPEDVEAKDWPRMIARAEVGS